MPDLAATQQRFAAALSGGARDDDLLQLFTGDAVHARGRFAHYRANVVANAARALAAAYPIVRKLVGTEFFAGLAREYCRRHPSASGDLNELGAHFADFLGAFEHTQSLPYLPDVARMEWLAHVAHYAADHPPLDPARISALAARDYPRLALKLPPGTGLLASPYPLCRIWEVHQDDYGGEIAVDVAGGGDRLLVYRPQFRATVARLEDGEFAFLTAIVRGELLGASLACALAADPKFDLGASLQRWVATHVVVDIRIANA